MSPAQATVAALLALGVACAMEPWSRLVHRALWHGVLYRVHRTHHPPPGSPPTRLEANDVFSILHAIPGVVALYLGFNAWEGWAAALAAGVGAGMSLYGVAYMVVHDGLVHRRLPLGALRRWRLLRRVAAAHEVHHRSGGPPYGLFLGPQELRARAVQRRAAEPREVAVS